MFKELRAGFWKKKKNWVAFLEWVGENSLGVETFADW
jgi:hypothetical protein